MNDRILELADEAEDYADSIMDQGGEFHQAYTKKFAELIVKDTLDLIEKESEKVSEKWTCKDGVHIWWKIVEHFGVEE